MKKEDTIMWSDLLGLIPEEDLIDMPELIIAESVASKDEVLFWRMIEAPLEALAKVNLINGEINDESVFEFKYRDKKYRATFKVDIEEVEP